MRTAGLVLAAGSGSRFGGPKATARIDNERFVDRAVRLLRAADIDPVLVVLGAWVGDVPDATVIPNPEWASGMGSSLRAGLRALSGDPGLADVSAVMITLVDLPGLTTAAITRLRDCPASISAATYHGQRGHPVKLARRHWAEAAGAAEGDAGARGFLAAHPEVTLIEVSDVASGLDVDVPEDLPRQR